MEVLNTKPNNRALFSQHHALQTILIEAVQNKKFEILFFTYNYDFVFFTLTSNTT